RDHDLDAAGVGDWSEAERGHDDEQTPFQAGNGTATLGRPRGCGGIGRRARFRSVWGKPRGGSSPLIRIARTRGSSAQSVRKRGGSPSSWQRSRETGKRFCPSSSRRIPSASLSVERSSSKTSSTRASTP